MSPLASLQVEPPFGEAPLTINYTATNSFDPDGKIISYRVSFGDGENSADSAGTHTYNYDKDYQIELTVEDNLGYTHSASTEIKVATSPVAVLKITPIEGPFPLECLIDGTASADSQGGKLEHDIYINNQLEYDNIDNIIHTFDAPEQYLVRLVVTSQRNGLTDAAHQSVTVINIDPNADFSWEPPFPQHQTPVTYTSTSIDSNLTDEITYYKWTFPSGLIKQGADSAIVHQAFDAGVDSYKVKLEVWDKYGGEGFIEKIVTKSN